MPAEPSPQGATRRSGPFGNWPLRRKLLAAFLTIFAGTFLVNWVADRWLMGRVVHHQVAKESENSAAALDNLVKAAIDTNIISYLKGIAEKNGEIVASLNARVQAGEMDEATARREAAQILLAQRVGSSGYIYVVDGQGILRVHPKTELQGANYSEQAHIQEQLRQHTGYLEFLWAGPDDGQPKPRALYMTTFAPWDWIISVTADRDDLARYVNTPDFRKPFLALRNARTGEPVLVENQGTLVVASPGYLEEFRRVGPLAWITGLALLLSAALGGAVTIALGRTLTRPLMALAERVSRTGEGSLEPVPVDGTDEVGTLALAFNGFLARIQGSQHRLEESEGRYRRLFEQAVEGIFQSTKEGRFLAANPSLALTLGYSSPEELLAEVEAVGGDLYLERRARKDLWCRLESAGVVLGFQTEFRRRDGSPVWVRINARAVHEDGRFAYIEGFLSDISEEYRQREALLEQQRELEARVEGRTVELRQGIERLERHNQELADLHEFTEMLQLCQGLPESIPVIEAFLPRLFPGAGAELFLKDPASDLLAPITPGAHGEFPVEDCWALREGKPYARAAQGGRPRCAHQEGLAPVDSLCLPVLAGGEMHGLIQVLAPDSQMAEFQRHGKIVAETLAFTLTTLKLRVRLREQAIRDPLTGLYNRRYLEEVAHREFQRAARWGHPVGVALFDIDHFKAFNDEHGHDAGDAVLAQLTRFIGARLREGDLAFRVGGEEFLLLLTEADGATTLAKMEDIRREVETELLVKHRQLNLTVTISAGVTAFPADGASLEDLLKVADGAMYRAKAEGRNRVLPGGQAPSGTA
jgi:diguanylate cyclase (GGDEF)-like protein/PAS domain S-box-containing protein